jgi:pimeloyl-ACP methyl ester carboxylesterase
VDGRRHSVIGADGTSIGLLTAGAGPALLLVHGGMGRLEGWGPIWPALAERRLVTAMDRRGRAQAATLSPTRSARNVTTSQRSPPAWPKNKVP